MKEFAIGEVAEIDGKRVKCVVTKGSYHNCGGCRFIHESTSVCDSIKCTDDERDGGGNVHFEEVPADAD